VASSDRNLGFVLVLLLALAASVLGCDAEHLMLAQTIEVRDLGPVSLAIDSPPVVASDGATVIYLRRDNARVMARSLADGSERLLFPAAAGWTLWTTNPDSGSLFFSVPNGSGTGRHIRECRTNGSIRREFSGVDGAEDTHAAISPDGTRLIFVRKVSTQALMQRDANDVNAVPTQVSTFNFNEDIHAIRWLTDQSVLTSSAISGNPAYNQVRFLSSQVNNQSGMGEWATAGPDGATVVSLVSANGVEDWWLSRVDGSEMTRVTSSSSHKQLLNWSADGRMLVYETYEAVNATRLEIAFLPTLK
jgi:Tol biopolymer transport system component